MVENNKEPTVFSVNCGPDENIRFDFSLNFCSVFLNSYENETVNDIFRQLSSLKDLQEMQTVDGKDLQWFPAENQVSLNDGLLILKHWLHSAVSKMEKQKPIALT